MSKPHLNCLLALVAAGILAGAPALAAQNDKAAEKAAEKAARRAAFLRGDDSTKGKPAVLPRTMAEAAALKRTLPNGIVEIPMSEDLMSHTTAKKRADGSIVAGHGGHAEPVRQEAKE